MFDSDYFIDPQLITDLTNALDELTGEGLIYESYRAAMAVLRRSGRYSSLADQSQGTGYESLSEGLHDATDRLLEAQGSLIDACCNIDIFLKAKSALSALDTLRESAFTGALTPALEGFWGHYESNMVWPADERRERIADVSTALSVLRRIAKADAEADTPERRQERAAAAESLKQAQKTFAARGAARKPEK
jgi:hypothetical protein